MSAVACQSICMIAANASSERTAFAIAQVFFLRNYAKEPPCNCGNRQFPQFHGGTFVQVQQTARSRICTNNCCASGACRHLRKRFLCPIAHREVKVYGGSWVSVSSAPVPAACLKRQGKVPKHTCYVCARDPCSGTPSFQSSYAQSLGSECDQIPGPDHISSGPRS